MGESLYNLQGALATIKQTTLKSQVTPTISILASYLVLNVLTETPPSQWRVPESVVVRYQNHKGPKRVANEN